MLSFHLQMQRSMPFSSAGLSMATRRTKHDEVQGNSAGTQAAAKQAACHACEKVKHAGASRLVRRAVVYGYQRRYRAQANRKDALLAELAAGGLLEVGARHDAAALHDVDHRQVGELAGGALDVQVPVVAAQEEPRQPAASIDTHHNRKQQDDCKIECTLPHVFKLPLN